MISELGLRVGKHLPTSVKDKLRPLHDTANDIEKYTTFYFHDRKPDQIVDTGYGFKLSIDTSDFVQRRHVTAQAEPEDFLTEYFYERVSDIDGDFVDVGANIGFYSLLYCANNSGTAFAFEPLSYNVDRIRKNSKLNNIDRIDVHPVGLSDTPGELRVYYYPHNKGAASSESTTESWLDLQQSDVCEFRRLDDVDGLSDDIGLMKIDVEGHELDVLRGGERFIRDQKPHILIETHPHRLENKGQSLEAVVSTVFSLGYDSIYLVEDELEFDRQQAMNSLETVRDNYGFWCEA